MDEQANTQALLETCRGIVPDSVIQTSELLCGHGEPELARSQILAWLDANSMDAPGGREMWT